MVIVLPKKSCLCPSVLSKSPITLDEAHIDVGDDGVLLGFGRGDLEQLLAVGAVLLRDIELDEDFSVRLDERQKLALRTRVNESALRGALLRDRQV